MKKNILIGLLLILVGAAQAQVTIWEKYYQTTRNQETYKYDTVAVLAYPTQFQKGEIDSITLLVSPKFTIEEKELQLRFGAQYALHYSIFPATEAITWTSGDPFVARVTDGVITAIGRGETTITGTTKDGTTQSVVVKCSEISVAINLPSTVLRQGEGMPISATIDAGSEQARNCLWSWKPEDRATLYLGHTLYGNTCGPLTLTATADTTDAQGQYIWHNSAHLDVIAQDQTGVPPYSLLDSIRRKSGENMVLLCVHFDQQPCYGMQFVRYNYLTSKYGKLREVDAVRYPSWYYIIAGTAIKGTFVQESSIGRLNADYQTGDASTWQYVGGLQATFDSTDNCAAYFNFPKSGVYTYRSTAFTSNDCASIDTINYDEVQVCGEEYLEWYIIKSIGIGKGAIERINGINAYLSQQWVQDTIAWYNEKYGASIPTSLSVPSDTTKMVVIAEPVPRVTRDCHTERVPITNESKQANPRQVSNPETGEIDGKIQLWKNGQQVQWPYGYVYDHTISNLDSISLVRYSTKNIRMLYPGVDTVYLQNKAEGYTKVYSCPMLWEPYYSFDTLEFSLSNPSILTSPSVYTEQLYRRFCAANQLSTYYNSHGTFSFIPAKAGQTDVTIRSGKAQTKKRIVVLEPDKKIYATADSLLQMIYNRMAITGSQMPDGACDIPNIDEGTASFYRLMWELNEFPADHIWWIWNDVGLADLRTHSWSTNNDLIRGLYARLYFNIDLCNQYLELTQSDVSKKSERAEVRFMRAFYYSYLLDLFGNVPLITQHVLKDYPTQSTRKQVFLFVVDELEQAALNMPEPGYRATNYRVDKAAAWLLLSRVYLNSEVYCGLNYMDKAAEYAYKVIKCPYKLSSNYQNLFMGDNNERYFNVGNDAVQEIILSIDQNPKTTYCWGGSRFLIGALRDENTPYCGINDTWKCARSKTNLVEAFTTLQKAYSIKASNTAEALGDDRGIFCSMSDKGKTWSLKENMSDDFYACWAIVKYTNLGASSSYTPSDENWPDMDIPIMRKAEAYLNYAEAVLRGGAMQGNYTALSAVNELRTRAHATPFETISLEELLNEWAREFYAEGRRRMDLIRFGMFSGQNTYNWEGKGKKIIDAHYNLYPIPQNMIDWNPNLKQNPGY